MLLILTILFLQSLAIFFDNLSIFRLISNHQTKDVALQLAKRGQMEFFCRGFLFFCPPLLGILLMNGDMYLLLLVFLACSFSSLFITILQSFLFLITNNISLKLKFSFLKNKKDYLFLFFGIFVYFIYLFIPFFLNIIGLFFHEHSVWIVQLSPALTTISTMFVIFYMDPKLAILLDKKSNLSDMVYEIITIRIIGRFFLVLFSAFLTFL